MIPSGSGESVGASSRHRYSRKWKKGAGGRSAEPSWNGAPAKDSGGSPPKGVKPENADNPKAPRSKLAGASPVSDSSDGKKADSRPAPLPVAVKPVIRRPRGASVLARVRSAIRPMGRRRARGRRPCPQLSSRRKLVIQKPRGPSVLARVPSVIRLMGRRRTRGRRRRPRRPPREALASSALPQRENPSSLWKCTAR